MNEPNESTSASLYDELKWGNSAPPLDANEEFSSPARHSDPSSHCDDATTHSLVDTLHAERTALLVVDVQPEYWSQCPPVRKDFPHFPEKLQATVDICRQRTVAKIIWVRADYRYSHSPWLKQFARIHGIPSDDDTAKNDKNMRAEVPCDPTSKDFQWEPFATPIGGDVIIPKSSWSSTSNTALMDILKAADVDTVLVCGLITSVCVQHSAFGIFEAGYRTILVTDACADRGKARHEAALALYGDYMYMLITSDELPRRLLQAKPLWALPPIQQEKERKTTTCPRYSPVPPASSPTTLSTSTSASSLSSSAGVCSSHTDDAIASIMSDLRI